MHTGQGGLAERTGGLDGLLECWRAGQSRNRRALMSRGLARPALLWMRRGSGTVWYEYDPAGV